MPSLGKVFGEGDGMSEMSMRLTSTQVADGFAVVLKYLQEAFHGCQVDIIAPEGPEGVPDRDVRNGGPSRSVWVHCPDPQRVRFDSELLRNLAHPYSAWGVHTLREWSVADVIRGAADAVRVTIGGPKEA